MSRIVGACSFYQSMLKLANPHVSTSSSDQPNVVILQGSDEPATVGRTAAIPFHLRYNTHRVSETHSSNRRGERCHAMTPMPDCNPLFPPFPLSAILLEPRKSISVGRFGLGSDPSRLPNPGWAMERAKENAYGVGRCLCSCSLDDSDSRSASAAPAQVIKKRRRPLRSRPRFPEHETGQGIAFAFSNCRHACANTGIS